MIDQFTEWYEAQKREKLALSEAQYAFLARHGIGISDAYIGMLRAYCENRTVWQTSAWGSILGIYSAKDSPDGMKGWFKENDLQMRHQLHEWVNDLMVQPEDEIKRRLADHIYLYST